MNKKIKIIEIFQKYANHEKLPKKITYEKQVFNLYNDSLYATDRECLDRFMDYINYDLSNLNDEVEILEDNTEEIEELDNWFVDERKECREFDIQAINLCFSKHRDKINQLVRAVNKLRKEQK